MVFMKWVVRLSNMSSPSTSYSQILQMPNGIYKRTSTPLEVYAAHGLKMYYS